MNGGITDNALTLDNNATNAECVSTRKPDRLNELEMSASAKFSNPHTACLVVFECMTVGYSGLGRYYLRIR